jgi:Protein of unknown function (DUF5131)
MVGQANRTLCGSAGRSAGVLGTLVAWAQPPDHHQGGNQHHDADSVDQQAPRQPHTVTTGPAFWRRSPRPVVQRRFLSLEPLLGPLPSLDLAGIDWVIVGGESGPGFRPLDLDWVRDVRDRCSRRGITFKLL